MKILAHLQNRKDEHQVTLTTNGNAQNITIVSKIGGFGSSVSGGELLCLALATCYCNDVYREAAKRGIVVEQVEVEVESEFGKEGESARYIGYHAKVSAHASVDTIRELMTITNRMAEIQKTVRKGLSISLENIEAISL
jgi:uncharacterized OsmC-like protein